MVGYAGGTPASVEGGLLTTPSNVLSPKDKVIEVPLPPHTLRITAKFAECFRDYRDSSYTDYSVHQLLAQRVYGIVLGYEDVNDHDKLRYDPALAIAKRKTRFY